MKNSQIRRNLIYVLLCSTSYLVNSITNALKKKCLRTRILCFIPFSFDVRETLSVILAVFSICNVSPSSRLYDSRCGEPFSPLNDCNCDSKCQQHENCCDDYKKHCGQRGELQHLWLYLTSTPFSKTYMQCWSVTIQNKHLWDGKRFFNLTEEKGY